MFSQDELQRYITQLLESPFEKRWDSLCATPHIQYVEETTEEIIDIHQGLLHYFSDGKISGTVDPILYWIHSAFYLSEPDGSFLDKSEIWTKREHQDSLLKDWIGQALCHPVSIMEFNLTCAQMLEGRLPKVLEIFAPLTQVMCMMDDWNSKVFIGKTSNAYLTFSWETTA